MSTKLRNILVLIALFVITVPVSAQLTTGTITGMVTDETRAVVPGAEVIVRNPETGLTRTITTNETGRYEAPNLPVGTYEVTGRNAGFGTVVRRGIELTVGRNAVVDLALPV